MDIKNQIQVLWKEADLYQSQGLLQEAKETYLYLGELLKKNEKQIKNKKIFTSLSEKIRNLNKEINRVENEPVFKEMPENVQKIIKTKFAFSKEGTSPELEGAIALAKFGQYEAAIKEFKALIQNDALRADSAMNIIRCYKIIDKIEIAVAEYQEWNMGNLFSLEELNKIRAFLQNILTKKGINQILPAIPPSKVKDSGFSEAEFAETQVIEPGAMGFGISDNELAELEKAKTEISEPEIAGLAMAEQKFHGEIPDISSVEIALYKGAKKGDIIEFDVSFQSGNTINLLISNNDKELLESLDEGMLLSNVRFYSPMAMFSGQGKITSKTQIETGPKQGDYSLDIEITIIN